MKRAFFCFLLFSFNCYCQDCKVINSFTSFHGLKFGEFLPDSLKSLCINTFFEEDSTYILSPRSLTEGDIIKYQNFFYLGGAFESINFHCSFDNRLYSFVLVNSFSMEDSINLYRYKRYPKFYEEVTENLINLFGGKPKEFVQKSKVLDGYGGFVRQWQCSQIEVKLTLLSAGEAFYLEVTDRNLERLQHIELYKH